MDPLLVNVLAFLAVFLIVFAANAVLVDLHSRNQHRVKKRMEERFRQNQIRRARSLPARHDFNKLAAEVAAEGKQDRSLSHWLQYTVEQSGMDITVHRLLTFVVCFALVAAVGGGFALRSMLFGLVAGAIGAAIPVAYVYRKRAVRN